MNDEQGLIEPPIPADATLADWPNMPIEVGRLLQSKLARWSSPETFRCEVLAWATSWHQTPAGSLPNDPEDLVDWLRLRISPDELADRMHELLPGWELATDGRLYHPVVTEKVLEALQKRKDWKRETRQKSLAGKKGAAARWGDKRAREKKSASSKPQQKQQPNSTANGSANGSANGTPNGSANALTNERTNKQTKTPFRSFPAGGDPQAISEQSSADVRAVLSTVRKALEDDRQALADDAGLLHKQIGDRLQRHGLNVTREHSTPNRGDGRAGRIDLLVCSGQTRVGIEIDSQAPRQKSISKLLSTDLDARVIVLRGPDSEKIPGIDDVIALDIGQPALELDAPPSETDAEIVLPLKAGKQHLVYAGELETLASQYPSIDVRARLGDYAAYLTDCARSAPSRLPTERGIRKAIRYQLNTATQRKERVRLVQPKDSDEVLSEAIDIARRQIFGEASS